MKNLKCQVALFALASLLASTVSAHPGHDHSHWMSGGVHALLAMAVLAVVASAAVVIAKRKQKAVSKDEFEG